MSDLSHSPKSKLLFKMRKGLVFGLDKICYQSENSYVGPVQVIEEYRGHIICEEPTTKIWREVIPQGVMKLPENLTISEWRHNIDRWILAFSHLKRYSPSIDLDPDLSDAKLAAHKFWSKVMKLALVAQDSDWSNPEKLPSIAKSITIVLMNQCLNDIAYRLDLSKEFRSSTAIVMYGLGQLGLLETRVLLANRISDRKKTHYLYCVAACTHQSFGQLRSVGRPSHLIKQEYTYAESLLPLILDTADELGIIVGRRGGFRRP